MELDAQLYLSKKYLSTFRKEKNFFFESFLVWIHFWFHLEWCVCVCVGDFLDDDDDCFIELLKKVFSFVTLAFSCYRCFLLLLASIETVMYYYFYFIWDKGEGHECVAYRSDTCILIFLFFSNIFFFFLNQNILLSKTKMVTRIHIYTHV